jgi:hypothetical protein
MTLRHSIAIAGLLAIGAAPLNAASPMKLVGYLAGTWNCSSTVGGTTTTYTANYAYALGGKWLRTINASKKYQSEDMMTYVNRGWTVIDMEPTGTMSVLTAPDTGVAHFAFKTQYPKAGLTVTFDRVSMMKYTLTFGGTQGGKPVHWVDTCTKR